MMLIIPDGVQSPAVHLLTEISWLCAFESTHMKRIFICAVDWVGKLCFWQVICWFATPHV